MRCIALVLALASVLPAQEAAPKEQPEAKPKPEPRVLSSGKAPTPFTAAEIREASPKGRISLFRITGGGQTLFVRFRFGESDAETSAMETLQLDKDRKPLAKPVTRKAKWRDLQAHASFDKNATTITEAKTEVPFGTFDCLVYTIKGTRGVQRFSFAKDLPGPPVKMEVEVGGKVLQTMELVDHRSFDYGAVFGPQAPGPALPEGAKLDASVSAKDESGALRVTARVAAETLPDSARLMVTAGPLQGAVLDLAPSADGKTLVCDKELPGVFRMATGNLAVKPHVLPKTE
jgi:hypothetical protein